MLLFQLPQALNQTANVVKGFAIAIGIAVALVFVWKWWGQRQRERQAEAQARAKAIWGEWLRLVIAHPDLAAPDPAAPAGSIRYKAFVASLVAAADQILLLDPASGWKAAISGQLELHRAYLASDEFRTAGMGHCTPALQKLVAELRVR
jgi:hypothetical protein